MSAQLQGSTITTHLLLKGSSISSSSSSTNFFSFHYSPCMGLVHGSEIKKQYYPCGQGNCRGGPKVAIRCSSNGTPHHNHQYPSSIAAASTQRGGNPGRGLVETEEEVEQEVEEEEEVVQKLIPAAADHLGRRDDQYNLLQSYNNKELALLPPALRYFRQQSPYSLKAIPSSLEEVKKGVAKVRSILRSIEDGEITVSPYDTAWVALVPEAPAGSSSSSTTTTNKPQFPSSLEWVANNQLPDGSWGDSLIFQAHDRLINTLACLIALKSWDLYPDKCAKAMDFIKLNLSKLGHEEEEHMPIGFEIAFPSLIEMARGLGIQIPVDDAREALEDIYAKRQIKLSRIPQGIMQEKATTLLHSLEGMMAAADLDWEKLLKLQCKDGSFLFSPSSTAFALFHTRNSNCFTYLDSVARKFNGGVPNVYPVDLFERLWVVDRLHRLGISRFFQHEIKDLMDYIYRYWTEKGICWARNSQVQDIDDTAMGFRLLRLHGYNVSSEVFRNFKKDNKSGEFICFAGQSTQAVTGMFNLLRASQLQFPGELLLQEAQTFSFNYLNKKRAFNQLLDKWIITKDLPGEVGYALDMPWYASLPRIESRIYIEQYGGEEDVWIGKTLYRMPYVNNNTYLELAKFDFNTCQKFHRLEWDGILRWYEDYNLEEYGMSSRSLLRTFFLATANIFEPEKSSQRLAWAKTWTMMEAISSYFSTEKATYEQRRGFASQFLSAYGRRQGSTIFFNHRIGNARSRNGRGGLVAALTDTLSQLSLEAMVTYGRDIHRLLAKAWERWIMTWEEKRYRIKEEAKLLAVSIILCSSTSTQISDIGWFRQIWDLKDENDYEEEEEDENFNNGHVMINLPTTTTTSTTLKFDDHHDNRLRCLFDSIGRLGCLLSSSYIVNDDGTTTGGGDHIPIEVDIQMQRLAEMVLTSSSSDDDDIDPSIRQVFLAVARSFYYTARCPTATIDSHVRKVLFQKLD